MILKVIGLSGKAGTGKNYLAQKYFVPSGYFEVSLAWHFKVWLISTKQATYEELFHTKPPHIRELIQQEGTDRGRNHYGDHIWVDTLLTWMHVWNASWGIDKFIIPDIRFKSELYTLRNHGCDVYRISAPGRVSQSILTPEQKLHQSEVDLDDVPLSDFSGIIHNDIDASHEYLQQQIQNIVLDKTYSVT